MVPENEFEKVFMSFTGKRGEIDISRMSGDEEKVRNGEGEGEGGPKSEEENILVSVRLRPLDETETARNDGMDWECINENTIIMKNSIVPTAYTFDKVFGFDCPTKQVYEEGAKEVILSVVRGINSTIFAYGQTSSGKTYTMNGITEYAVADIYDCIEVHKDREFVLKFSAMEIYNEAVRDLLSIDSTPLRLLDDPEKGTVVEKLTEEVLRDQNHLQELLSICEMQRQIGETSLNETSSRSHQILRLTIESSAREYRGLGSSSTLTATVNFVDLAGSERASQTLSTGSRLKEGSHINRSLLTLGTVIRKLSNGKNSHIPYRDSKLTRILQNSLGGNARTAIICTLSPAHSHVEQSKNTLFFASCAKEVTTNAKVNVVMSDKALVKQLKRELAKMENELRSLTSKPVSYDPAELLREKELLIEQMDKEIKELTKQRDLAESRIGSILGSVGEYRVPRLDEHLGSKSTSGIRTDELSIFNSNNHQEEASQYSEDSFLLDNSSPKFVGPDPSQGPEENAQENVVRHGDIRKEVRFAETDKLKTHQKREAYETLLVPAEKGGSSVLTAMMNEGAIPSVDDDEKELSPTAQDCSYDALKQKVQDMQRTINCLVNLYPSENSLVSSEACMSSSRSLKLTRSKSCKASLTTTPSSDWLEEVEQNENAFFAGSEMDSPGSIQSFSGQTPKSYHGANIGKLSRKDSHSSTLSATYETEETKESDIEETIGKESSARTNGFKQNPSGSNHGLHIKTFHRYDSRASVMSSPFGTEQTKEIVVDNTYDEFSGENLRRKLFKSKYGAKASRLSRKHSRASVLSAPPESYDSKESDSEDTFSVLNFVPEQEVSARRLGGNTEHSGLSTLQSPPQNSFSWPSEFERRRQEIIELWDACYVPLVHRTYFFLLFKGDPSDSVYLEVELRRLFFLKETLSLGSNVKKDSQIATPASSLKILNREREMLGKQVHKKYTRNERERLYQKWGIKLNTKQRSLQVAHRLWTNTRDLEHSRESAVLVAKLIGFVETGQAPKEIFGLSVSPQPINRKPFAWRRNMSSLS